MYVCICNAITDRDIRNAVRDGVTNLWDLQSTLGIATGCGSCMGQALDVLRDCQQGDTAPSSPPVIHSPAVA